MVKLIRILLCSGVFSVGLLANANAALETRLGGLAVYDTDIDITWLADANYAKTSGYDADGVLSWPDAKAWAAGLSIEGVTGWRLPAADTSCTGYNCNHSEMGHLFYDELGGIAGHSVPSSSFFSNIREYLVSSDYFYWTGTEFAPDLGWIFFFDGGRQAWGLDTPHYGFAWAVHDGDVGAALVPEPEAYAMMSIGLLMLFGSRRLKQC
ncbi:MAG: DUF1566 domain-containing protein [Nitrosomonas sp.]|uniref:PEP-CTERM sorting domain-containing protein n=1 Tax=Nitrosomonas sp. TaxID=42353 RepID=UPI0032EC876E